MTSIEIHVTPKELWAVKHILGKLHDTEGAAPETHTKSVHLKALVEGDVYDLCQSLKARIHGTEEY